MTGNKKIHVVLQLDNMARNLLVEEFEGSENELMSNDNGRSWILETDVYQIAGIGRFYIGLAEHIKIISAPELKAYAQELIRKLRD